MSQAQKKKVQHFKFDDFEVAISYYQNSAVMIMHNGIPGFGSIIYCENKAEQLVIEQLLGQSSEYLNLFATQMANMMDLPSITFVFSFRPERLDSFEKIRKCMDDFQAILEKNLSQPSS